MLIKSVRGYTPQWGKDCFFAENATLIGDLILGDECSVWYQAVLRGDVHHIRIGNRVNIQDGAVIHATYKKAGTVIGNDVSIGHNAIVHGCTLHDRVLIGMGSIVMDNCVVHSNSIVAAGSVVTQNTVIEEGSICRNSSTKNKRYWSYFTKRRSRAYCSKLPPLRQLV